MISQNGAVAVSGVIGKNHLGGNLRGLGGGSGKIIIWRVIKELCCRCRYVTSTRGGTSDQSGPYRLFALKEDG